MIELRDDRLRFSFPEHHEDAEFHIDFQRTFRIPDDGNEYPLPPGFGAFSLEHVDDHAETVPADWLRHGGVMMPMFQSEALWLNFISGDYPFAVKIAAGKINAITGDSWEEGLRVRPAQDYLPVPGQPWLDGFAVSKGVIRQFTAMPLGSGYSVEEQVTGKAEFGGLQIVVYPMKKERYARLLAEREEEAGQELHFFQAKEAPCMAGSMGMGLAPGGKMRQEIYEDEFDPSDYDLSAGSRCFIHLCNSLVWRQVTGRKPPQLPYSAREYEKVGLPWFDYYDADRSALAGSDTLAGLKSVSEMAEEKGDNVLPDNGSVTPGDIIKLRGGMSRAQVREGVF